MAGLGADRGRTAQFVLPRAARDTARWLHSRAGERAERDVDHDRIASLPEPARRWLNHAIDPGTRCARQITLTMHGDLALRGRWRGFSTLHVLVPWTGFVSATRTDIAGLPVVAVDSYAGGQGRVRWRVLGLPTYSTGNPGVTRSFAERLAAEAALLPTSLIDAQWWSDGDEPDRAVYRHHVDGRHARPHVTVQVDADGRLVRLELLRWGRPAGAQWGEYRFEVCFDGELEAGGLRLPSDLRAAWVLPGDRQEWLRATIGSATSQFRPPAGSGML